MKVTYDQIMLGRGPAPVLCTSFAEFTKSFGGFPTDQAYRNLAHAVYGFFNNGGTRCFVSVVDDVAHLDLALEQMAAVDEVALSPRRD